MLDLEAKKNYQKVVFHSVVTFIGLSFMQVVDLLFCHDLGSSASATVGTATSLISWFLIVGIGLVSSLEYFIPRSLGEGNETKARAYFSTGVWVACGISLLSMMGLMVLAHFSPYLGVNSEIQKPVQLFCTITAPSYFAIFLAPVLRVELQARGRPHQGTLAFLWANLLNILLNWMLVLGHLGVPAMGIRGSAWANVLSRVGLIAYLVFQVWRVRAGAKQFEEATKDIPSLVVKHTMKPQWEYAKNMIVMGLPTSLHMLFEMGAFVFVSTIASQLPPAQNAAHAIALSIASFAFMIPMGLSSGAAVTMSKAIGEKNIPQAKHFASMTIKLGLYYAVFGFFAMIFFRRPLLHLYTGDAETIFIGANILFIAAIFQFGDAMQVILAGVLRGVGETRIQAQINAVGHWLIGVPIGLTLLYRYHMGVTGLWIGLSAGLFSAAIGLAYRWKKFPIDGVV
jgi:MATE family multidrug resistance protein